MSRHGTVDAVVVVLVCNSTVGGGRGGSVLVGSRSVERGGIQWHISEVNDPLVDAEDGCLETAVEPLARSGCPSPGSNRATTVPTLR